jgi:uncharacterized protein (TIGR03086 family)
VLPESPAERHRAVSGLFSDLTEGVAADPLDPRGWNSPAPVDGWLARDVVRHLTTWFPGFLASGTGIVLPAGPSVDVDPVAAWRTHADAVQRVLDDPETATVRFRNPHTGEHALADAIDRFYTADVFMHSWDLATATNQPIALDPDFCSGLLEGMEQLEGVIRSSGQYGPRVEVPEGSDPQTRLVGFIGRDPSWAPPG